MTHRLPLTALPPKPRHGAACNGCGLCCHLELCAVAAIAFPAEQQAPCPAMVFESGRVFCAFVLAEQRGGLEPMIATGLGIGSGCSMPDENIP